MRKKAGLWLLLLMFAFAVMAGGGCGSSGGGSSGGNWPPPENPLAEENDNGTGPIGFELAEDEHITVENVVPKENVFVSKEGVEYDAINDLIRISDAATLFIGNTEDFIWATELKVTKVVVGTDIQGKRPPRPEKKIATRIGL